MAEARALNLAFLGCGAATAMHSRTVGRMRAGVHRFYASRDGTRAASFEREYEGAGSFGSYDAALQDPRVDVVLIATPPVLHLPLALQALENGKHVIVEKPPFFDVADLDRVSAAARAAQRQVFVAENYFYKQLTTELRTIIRSGVLGDVLFITANALKTQRTGDWRDDAAVAGGDALYEGGIHWISLLGNIGLTIRGVRVVRAGNTAAQRARNALVAIDYAEGAAGVLAYSWDVYSPLRGLRISRVFGTRNTVAFESNGLFVAVGARVRFAPGGVRKLRGFEAMFTDFFHALRTGTAPQYTLDHARRDLELATATDAALTTAEPTGRP